LAPADTLFVLDNCGALFLSNGENYDPWIPVSFAAPFRRDFTVSFSRSAGLLQRITLVSVGRDVVSTVSVEYKGSRMRVAYTDPLFSLDSLWTPVRFGRQYHVDVIADIPRQSLTVNIDGSGVVQSLISSAEMEIRDYSPPPTGRTIDSPFVLKLQPVGKSPLCTRLLALNPRFRQAVHPANRGTS
jgi:hypothetical protein